MAAMLPRYSVVTEHCTETVLKCLILRNRREGATARNARYSTYN
jgi:hypothetical protein